MSITMTSVAARSAHLEMTNAELSQIALRVADCRSLTALRDAIFSHADSMIGVVGMGLYLFDRAERLQLISSRQVSQDFLDQCEREFPSNSMLDCIVTARRTVDGFHFHGARRWRHSSTYHLLRGWGIYHNMGGPFVVGGRVVGALFAGTALHDDPYDATHVKRLELLCRAGSLALTAMRERERLRCELSNAVVEDWPDPLPVDKDWSGDTASSGAPAAAPGNQGAFDHDRPLDRLPTRSREVAWLLCQGQSNKAIARQLGISAHTVKEHVQNLCRRFSAINRTDLVHRLLISS
jgi:DNA-binding CsgD family transcriptional regulator